MLNDACKHFYVVCMCVHVCAVHCYCPTIYTRRLPSLPVLSTIHVFAGAVFGDPHGSNKTCVVLYTVMQSNVLDTERKNNTSEKLARALLQLLFSSQELATGNCTKPTRPDINELDSERLWAIKCKYNPYNFSVRFNHLLLSGHIDYVFPLTWRRGRER